MIQVQDQAIC